MGCRRSKLYEAFGQSIADWWEETVDRWTLKHALVQGDMALSFETVDESEFPWAGVIGGG
jgi:uncharacterized iron-regulated protein